ncbi:MAG: nucleotidyl transferase AbiEii/AbiGii toxin family protein [Nanoarchaeota archaeon]
MDEIRKINMDDLKEIIAKKGFTLPLLIKDYYLSLILYLIKDLEGIYFKGGTALNKIFLKHSRLSEDIDFSVTRDVKKLKLEISKILIDSRFFEKITYDKSVEGFLRIVVHYNLEGQKGNIFIDLNERAKLSLKPEKHKLNHFYSSFIPEFYVNTVAEEELIAEKIAACIGRNKPRDHFDVYKLIKAGIPINFKLVKKKCHDSGTEFSIIKMFNNANKLKNRWDKDMISLLAEPISFKEVIQFLSKHFKLKEEKKKLKK